MPGENTDRCDPLLCAARACHGCRVCGELIKPFPAGAHAVRVYIGEEQWCYQIVGARDGGYVNVVYSDGEGPWGFTWIKRTWFKGVNRELANALCWEAT